MTTEQSRKVVFWTARNGMLRLDGYRQAIGMRAARIDAAEYVINEFSGRGQVRYYIGTIDKDTPDHVDSFAKSRFNGCPDVYRNGEKFR